MASYPYARVSHLTGLELKAPYMQRRPWQKTDGTKTPTTLTGNPTALYSYDLRIMLKSDLGYWLHHDNSSPTTNRHIRAVASVLSDNGYTPSDLRTDDCTLWVKV